MSGWLKKRALEEREEGIVRPSLPEIPAAIMQKPICVSVVSALIIMPIGIPLVGDSDRQSSLSSGSSQRILWKLPGGLAKLEEDPLIVLTRHIRVILGIEIPPSHFSHLATIARGDTNCSFYQAFTAAINCNSRDHREREIRIFTPEDILSRRDFYNRHLSVVAEELRRRSPSFATGK